MALILPLQSLSPRVDDEAPEPPRHASPWARALSALLVNLHEQQRGDARLSLLLRSWVQQLCHQLENGHACVRLPPAEQARLRSPVILTAAAARTDKAPVTPLILEGNRLYLYRYWQDECRLAARLQALNQRAADYRGPGLEDLLDGLNLEQQQALTVALREGLTVITGGPGTGKTHTLARILAALLRRQATLRIALAAPTGKAAARMREAIVQAGLSLPDSVEAQTLHRLLGMGQSGRAAYDAQNPLPYEVIIVDEASMIDLRLAAQLADAIPASARLILLGDQNQLAAVESGAVLEEIGRAVTLTGNRVHLRVSRRFQASGGIGQLAAAIVAGEVVATRAVLVRQPPDLRFQPLEQATMEQVIAAFVQSFQPFIDSLQQQLPVQAILAAFDRFRVLCATRDGAQGVNAINQALSTALRRALGQMPDQALWFHGRPVLVTRNDYHLGVYNGDIGIALAEGEVLMVHFPAAEGGTHVVPAARLADTDTAFALTIHKSQGSEFEEVAVLLPVRDSAVLGRELLYTGITRARQRLQLWSTQDSLALAVSRQVERAAGLADKLDAIQDTPPD